MHEQFLTIPHFPAFPVSCVLMSDRQQSLIETLRRYDIRVITPSALTAVSGSERYHADMAVCHLGGSVFFVSSDLDNITKNTLRRQGCHLFDTEYPAAAPTPSLNICILGNQVLCHTGIADKRLLAFLRAEGKNILHTNQRYTKCSAAVIRENALITSDTSIERLCRCKGIDVLKITSGHIRLDGYSYGFIGGCCGMLSDRMLAFSGDIAQHPDYENIKAFCRNYGVDLLSLSNDILYDIGGILPVLERVPVMGSKK